ncbi:hypothetical protein [Larkinella terrae]|uniref:Uncharacterized protein n=1 Tax=Larkinella terrae TaxID=2025311 RepID=A0A7K0EEW4_9BACT|nr:hypothetical protein [Larkinella terrae]MRS60252.1 hypothetical protein [Larkinella terrae]
MKTLVLSLLLVGSALTTPLVQSDKGVIKTVRGAQKPPSDAVDFQMRKSYWAKVPYVTCMIYGNRPVGESVRKLLNNLWAICKPTPFRNRGANWAISMKEEMATAKLIDNQPR